MTSGNMDKTIRFWRDLLGRPVTDPSMFDHVSFGVKPKMIFES